MIYMALSLELDTFYLWFLSKYRSYIHFIFFFSFCNSMLCKLQIDIQRYLTVCFCRFTYTFRVNLHSEIP